MNNLAEYIDHTYLKIDAQDHDIERICDEAVKYGFKGVCVFPKFLQIAAKRLKGKKPILIAVIDFPLGNKTPLEKQNEAEKAIADGAEELDMVMDVMALKDKKFDLVYDGIKAVVDAAKNADVKVIIETCYLTDSEIIQACTIAKLANAKFVKTSTGFAKEGARVENVYLMKNVVGDDMGVKASGGIKTYQTAKMMIEAGATRLGTSASIQILEEEK